MGFTGVDTEHRELLELASHILVQQPPSSSLHEQRALFERLEAHLSRHFAIEEELMAVAVFPSQWEHRTEHARLVDFVGSLRHELQTGGPALDLLSISNRLLLSWVVTHINTYDLAFAEFLRRAGTIQ